MVTLTPDQGTVTLTQASLILWISDGVSCWPHSLRRGSLYLLWWTVIYPILLHGVPEHILCGGSLWFYWLVFYPVYTLGYFYLFFTFDLWPLSSDPRIILLCCTDAGFSDCVWLYVRSHCPMEARCTCDYCLDLDGKTFNHASYMYITQL